MLGRAVFFGRRVHSASFSSLAYELGLHRRLDSMAPVKQRCVVLFGPSGVGKSTLIKKLFAEHPDSFGFSVSHTTRQPRPGEQDGVHYNFVTREIMEKLIADSAFVEHAEYSGNHYGTSKAAVRKVIGDGRVCILDIDMQGVKALKKSDLDPETLYVFIRPPSMELLEKRLRDRGTESADAVEKRLAVARAEMDYGASGEFCHTVINDDLDQAYHDLHHILEPLLPKD